MYLLCVSSYSNREIQFKLSIQDFPGGPVVKNPPSNTGGEGSIPGQRIKIPCCSGATKILGVGTKT